MPVASSPGSTSGSTTRRNACSREQPSTIAASSSSSGTLAMKPRSVHTANGSEKTRYAEDEPDQRVREVQIGQVQEDRNDDRCQRHHLHDHDRVQE